MVEKHKKKYVLDNKQALASMYYLLFQHHEHRWNTLARGVKQQTKKNILDFFCSIKSL